MTEAQFTGQVIDVAHQLGWTVAHFKPAQIRPGVYVTPVQADGKGFPDLVLVRERVVYAELKMPGRKLEPQQEMWRDVLVEAGEEWYLWKPKDDYESVLKHVMPVGVRAAVAFVREHG